MHDIVRYVVLIGALATSACYYRESPRPVVTAVVGESGGRIEGPGMTLDIPAGALGQATEIRIAIVEPTYSQFETYSPVFHFEPEGLEFGAPVEVAIAAPDAPLDAVLLWTRRGDPSVFELAGFVEDGVARGLVSHFSEGAVAGQQPPSAPSNPEQECEDDQGTECPSQGSSCDAEGGLCPASEDAPCDAEACRSVCTCEPTGEGPRLSLCATNPGDPSEYPYSETRGRCPGARMNAELGPEIRVGGANVSRDTDGRDFAGERNGAPCRGFQIETVVGVICACRSDADLLCPRDYTPDSPSGTTVSCVTMARDATSVEDAPAPEEGDVPLGLSSFVAAVGAGLNAADYEGGLCRGHPQIINPDGTESSGPMLRGLLEGCQADQALGSHWVERPGEYAGCRRFARGPESPAMSLTPEQQARCRLTEDEANHLAQRRNDCGIPGRSLMPEDRRTLAILSMPGSDEITGLNGRVSDPSRQTSQYLRSQAVAAGTCSAPGERTYTGPSGVEQRFRGAGFT
ncbi:MAG: hypothetical protein K8H88_13515, partial [Sandaracinaceae bacterium]|nr:hypothetical protein [Sandaracinaceae bacterium]